MSANELPDVPRGDTLTFSVSVDGLDGATITAAKMAVGTADGPYVVTGSVSGADVAFTVDAAVTKTWAANSHAVEVKVRLDDNRVITVYRGTLVVSDSLISDDV